jgi:endonuclease/exonuclease/phosphatase family metal-dependent hydrolase
MVAHMSRRLDCITLAAACAVLFAAACVADDPQEQDVDGSGSAASGGHDPTLGGDGAGGAAASSPGSIKIEAEDFTSYYDTTPGNKGGAYRATDVDIEPCADTGGGYNVGWMAAGEWLEFAVTTAAGTFRIDSRVAALAAQSIRIEVDGIAVASTTVPATGAWQAWTTVGSPPVTLAAGSHRIRFWVVTGGINLNYLVLAPAGTAPYGGTARAVPGRVQAEDFDVGASGLAYYDTGAGNNGGAYRATDVDLEPTTDTGGGVNVGWMATGEWLQYTVHATAAGSYRIASRVAGRPAALRYEIDGVDVTGEIALPGTAGWQSWTTVTSGAFSLAAGPHTIRVRVATGGLNLNWFEVVPVATTASPRLDVMSWNLHHASNVAAQAQRVLDRGNPQVLCAQEVSPTKAEQLRAELTSRSGVTWHLRNSNTSDGTAILTRVPMLESEVRDLGGNSWGANRHGVRVKVAAGSTTVNVFCVHLDWNADRNMTNHIENRTRLLAWIDGTAGRKLLGGDLNAWTWGASTWEGNEQRQTHALLAQRMTHLCSSLRGSHDVCNSDWTNNGWLPDHFYRTSDLGSVSYSIVDHGGLSDHKMQLIAVDAL